MSPATFRHYGIAYGDGIVNNLRPRRGRCLAPALPASFAPRRDGRGGTRTSSTPTGSRAYSPHWRPGSRSCSSSGARTSRSRAACAADRVPAGRGGAGRRLRLDGAGRRGPRARGGRCARGAERGKDPRGRRRARRPSACALRRSALGGEGRPRAGRGSRRPPPRRRGRRPARSLFPQAAGFVPPTELGSWYERAAVVVVPSRREGYGMVAREAMAYGRPVVATAVGGLCRRGRGRRVWPARSSGRRRSAPRRDPAFAGRRRAARSARGGCARARGQDARRRRRRRSGSSRRIGPRAQSALQRRSVRSTRTPVEGRELLALLARARRVRDRDFVDPLARAEHAGGDLRLDREAPLPEAAASGRARSTWPCGRS